MVYKGNNRISSCHRTSSLEIYELINDFLISEYILVLKQKCQNIKTPLGFFLKLYGLSSLNKLLNDGTKSGSILRNTLLECSRVFEPSICAKCFTQWVEVFESSSIVNLSDNFSKSTSESQFLPTKLTPFVGIV